MSELGLVTPGGKVVWGKYAQGEPEGAAQGGTGCRHPRGGLPARGYVQPSSAC